jgi:hydrogenase maturation protein HypF
VGLCGGVFQNRTLCEQAQALLRAERFDVLLPCRLPVNDAAISFGQLIETVAVLEECT